MTRPDPGFQAGGLEISKFFFFFFQIDIHIVLINYQSRQILKNHCFLIYQDQFLKLCLRDMIIFRNWDLAFYGIGEWIFLGIGTSTFSEIGEWIFSRIETSTFFGIGITTLVVGNPTLTSKEFEYFLLK